MNDVPQNSHEGLFAGLASGPLQGIVLGWQVYDNLAQGIAVGLLIGVVSGLVVDWQRSR